MKHSPYKQVVEQYDQLLPAVLKMAEALEKLEPGGTLADEVVIDGSAHGSAFVTYCAKPLQLTIERGDKKYIFKAVDV